MGADRGVPAGSWGEIPHKQLRRWAPRGGSQPMLYHMRWHAKDCRVPTNGQRVADGLLGRKEMLSGN